MPRVSLETETPSNYFSSPKTNIEFVDAGCAVLNCVLGGGWALGRISNLVGDESTGKTLLAIEASANFRRQYPKGKIYYREAESAFDEGYAKTLGMPVETVEFIDPEDFVTVEDFYKDLVQCAEECSRLEVPGIYFLDSLDALTSKGELDRKFGEGTYGTDKARDLHKLFRLSTAAVERSNMHLCVISQTKDKIGSLFPQKTVSGGNSLKFFSSQRLMLSVIKEETRTINKVKRVVGVHIKAKCIKNKVSLSHRQCEFTITFGQGIDRLASSLNWLEDVFRLDDVIDCTRQTYDKRTRELSDEDYWKETARVDKEVVRIWGEIEDSFLEDTRSKV